jgi:hypothetical protein
MASEYSMKHIISAVTGIILLIFGGLLGNIFYATSDVTTTQMYNSINATSQVNFLGSNVVSMLQLAFFLIGVGLALYGLLPLATVVKEFTGSWGAGE